MPANPNIQIEKLRQALAALEAQERDLGLDQSAQKAELQAQLNVLIQNGGVQLGDGATVGGDVTGRDKMTAGGHVVNAGDGATVIINPEPTPTTPTVNSPRTNIKGNVTGPVLSGNFQGPVNVGDINVGNISGSTGIAIGHGAQVTVHQQTGLSPDETARVFASLMQKVNALSEGATKEDAQEAVKKLETEAKKGEQADEGRVRRSIEFLVEALPDAWEVAVNTVINPLAGINTVFKKIAERVKAERERKTSEAS